MKKKVESLEAYLKPKCEAIEAAMEEFICTSVLPDAPQTTEEEWEDGGEVDGGAVDF